MLAEMAVDLVPGASLLSCVKSNACSYTEWAIASAEVAAVAIPGGVAVRAAFKAFKRWRASPDVTKVTRSLDDLASLRGAHLSDVEKMADAKYLQAGWKKSPLKDGNGIRYFDGKGNSFQLNKGYPGGKEMHGGPYIKMTQGNQTIRIPLEGNPDL